MSQDPTRLLDDRELDGRLREDLRLARPGAAPEYDVEAGLARFMALVAAATTLGAATVAGAASAGTASGTAATAATAGAGAASAGASGAAATAGGVGLFAKVASVLVVAGAIGTGVVLGTAGDDAARVAPAAIESASSEAPAPSTIPTSSPTAAANPDSASEVASAPSQAPAEAAERAPTAKSLASSTPKPSASADARTASIKEEVEHMGRLREIARTDPARALAMANEGHARFPGGVLGQEREMVAINALVALGRMDEARARAGALIARNPESPFAERLRRTLGMR